MSRGSLHITMSLAIALAVTACSHPQDGSVPTSIEAADANTNRAKSEVPASLAWQQEARTLIGANRLSPLATARVLAALSVAQYRAVMTTYGSDDNAELGASNARRGGRAEREAIRGAVAGASAQVLTFFFPAAAATLEQRIVAEGEEGAGNVHPQFTRGVKEGRSVGDEFVERTKNDRFTAPWTGTVPTGPGKWVANGPPGGATFGGVQPYLLTSGSQFRAPSPVAFGSAAFQTDLDEIKTLTASRTPAQQKIALDWDYPAGTFTPPGYWNLTTAKYVEASQMNERAATHAFALTSVAMMDSFIGCWDSKYYYWVIRPSQADPSIALSFGLPNHPSYPSGHSCVSSAAATVLGHLFPERAAEVAAGMTEAGLSRMYAGIHYRFDVKAGQDLGSAVARWAIARDRRPGLLAAIR